MLSRLVDAIVRGDPVTWSLLALLWLLTAVAATLQKQPRGRGAYTRLAALLALTSAASVVGMAAVHALSVPRLTWRVSDEPQLVQKRGVSWRALRGPAVRVVVDGQLDIGIPSLDDEGRWLLFGLLSGKPVAELPAAEPGPLDAAVARVCDSNDTCRPWPSAWPPPTYASPTTDLSWNDSAALNARAYDVESGLYLVDNDDAPLPRFGVDLDGRLTTLASKEGRRALFALRRRTPEALDGMRVVATVAGENDPEYRVERLHARLDWGPNGARWIATPMLFTSLLGLPMLLMCYLLAPRWMLAWLRKRGAVYHELSKPMIVVPEQHDYSKLGLAVLSSDVTWADSLLPSGSVVALGAAAAAGETVVSSTWWELPGGEAAGDPDGAADAVLHPPKEGEPRTLGMLVPGDEGELRVAARHWVMHTVYAGAVFCAGLALAAPALVGVVSLFAGR